MKSAFKVTRTKSGMSIVTMKAFGFYANVSFGKSAKAKPAPARVEWHHSYDISVAASLHANEICARLFGHENVNVTAESRAVWFKYRDEFLAAHPKTERIEVRPTVKASPANRPALSLDWFGIAACAVLLVPVLTRL